MRRAGIVSRLLALAALVLASCAARTVDDAMPFPDERIKTFNAMASPVDANSLNLLQDAIIDGAHGLQYMTLDASKWEKISNATGAVAFGAHSGDTVYDPDTVPGSVVMSPELPEGTTLVSVEVAYYRSTGSMTFQVFDHAGELANTGNDADQIGDTITDAAGSGDLTATITNLPETTLAAWHTFTIRCDPANTANKAGAVRIGFKKSS